MPRREGDFLEPVIRVLGLRAGYICSNPDCRKPTAGPHSDPTKALITGEAAHICAAQSGGPRYDEHQSLERRRSATNGIWLCGDCNTKVDKDWRSWPAPRLHEMKDQHERWISGQAMIPLLPEITLATLDGLRIHTNLSSIKSDDLTHLREQKLVIRNPNRIPLHNFKMALCLPECVVACGHNRYGPGIIVNSGPADTPWTIRSVQGGGRVAEGKPTPTPNHTLELSALPASDTVEFGFYTAGPAVVSIHDTIQSPPCPAEDPDSFIPADLLHFFVLGNYQFLLRGEYVTADYFVPLRYSFKNREVVSLPAQPTIEGCRVSPTITFPGIEIHG